MIRGSREEREANKNREHREPGIVKEQLAVRRTINSRAGEGYVATIKSQLDVYIDSPGIKRETKFQRSVVYKH